MSTVFEQSKQVLDDKVRVHRQTVTFERVLREQYGITLPQFAVLVSATTVDDTVPLGDTAAALGVSRGNMTGITDRLVRDGFITRRESTKDRRITVLELTVKGADLMERIKADPYTSQAVA